MRGANIGHPGFYRWSAMPSRPTRRWPNGAKVAVAVIVALEYVEEVPPGPPFPAFRPAGGLGWALPEPDLPFLTHREYGVRVGLFRVVRVLTDLGLRPTIAIDAMTAEQYPFVVDYCAKQGAEFIAHGVSAHRLITPAMSEADERGYIAETMNRISEATNQTILGWLSPEQSESERTPLLLPDHGIRYICDWSNDDQPYPMSSGDLISVPVLLPLDDAFVMLTENRDPDDYNAVITRCFDSLRSEVSLNTTCMVFIVRPWVSGQPFRIRALSLALEHLLSFSGTWPCSVGEIAEAFREVDSKAAAVGVQA